MGVSQFKGNLNISKKNNSDLEIYFLTANQGPVVQKIISLTSVLLTNLLSVVANIFSDTLIVLLQKCE